MNVEKELRIMHACELGAVGVYRGHKCVARYFFRATLSELDNLRSHERDHASLFRSLLNERGGRLCFAHQLFFIGGLFYGVIVGLLGIKAIGISTYTIEEIVNEEFELALSKLKNDASLCTKIRAIQLEEQQHRDLGKTFAGNSYALDGVIKRMARAGAYTAKYFAASL